MRKNKFYYCLKEPDTLVSWADECVICGEECLIKQSNKSKSIIKKIQKRPKTLDSLVKHNL